MIPLPKVFPISKGAIFQSTVTIAGEIKVSGNMGTVRVCAVEIKMSVFNILSSDRGTDSPYLHRTLGLLWTIGLHYLDLGLGQFFYVVNGYLNYLFIFIF